MRCWMMMRISTRFLVRISKRNLDETHKTRLEIAEVSTRFLCQDMGIFPPCGLTNCHPYGTLARPTIPWHIYYKNQYSFYTEYIQIPYRLPNHINHAFIFNKPFNNIKTYDFGIILYKQWQIPLFLTLYRL